MKEVETIMKQRLIKIDGKTRTDPKFPTGFMDVVQIDKTGENFRIIYDVKGRFTVHRITASKALDLTSEERQLLLDIRRRKAELLQEISQLKEEITDISTEIDAMDTEEGAKQKTLAMGKKKFNMESKKGIQFLISHNLVAETPEEVAQFLYKEEGLNKTAIGDYLGEKNDFNEAVLKAFVELHDFTDLILVQALRQFLWSFRLPG